MWIYRPASKIIKTTGKTRRNIQVKQQQNKNDKKEKQQKQQEQIKHIKKKGKILTTQNSK